MDVIGDKNGDTKTSKNIKKFICNFCDFKCSKLGDWKRHIMTSKHVLLTPANILGDKNYINSFICEKCNKTYNSRN